jgi:dipeptidase
MCDTQIIQQSGHTYFAKNSDREASEPQVIVRIAPVKGDRAASVQTTYITVPQVPDRFGVILSKPHWIWGAEMGVNDQGVVIGNEAVFTTQIARKGETLLGMDLLRLGLERGANARDALTIITDLLQTHGQGGPAGYRDKAFRYDNSFIIADAHEAWILETAGRQWAAKKVESFGAISNCLSIRTDHDLHSDGLQGTDFAKRFDTRFMTFMGKARQRQALSTQCLGKLDQNAEASLAAMAANLRRHQNEDQNFARHTNGDVCMHAGGLTRPSQSCGSMIVKLGADHSPQVMVTGTSAPCLSLFKPAGFDFSQPLFFDHAEGQSAKDSLWHHYEYVHRRALFDYGFRTDLLAARDDMEGKMLSVFEGKMTFEDADDLARRWHDDWYEKARQRSPRFSALRPYDRFWKKLNARDGVFTD